MQHKLLAVVALAGLSSLVFGQGRTSPATGGSGSGGVRRMTPLPTGSGNPGTPSKAAPARGAGPNLILNGDFENNTASTCAFNLSNASFNASVADCTAFGTAEEIDLMQDPSGCGYVPAAISGSAKLAIHTTTSRNIDAFAFRLSQPVVAGQRYQLTFFAYSDMSFDPDVGVVEVGISDNPTSFGTQVFSGTPQSLVWTKFDTSITAPVSGAYLTVRPTLRQQAWIHVDAFSLCPTPQGFNVSLDTLVGVTTDPSLVKYDLAGNQIDTLPVIDTVTIGVMDGATVVGTDVWVCGTNDIVARVDLQTGMLEQAFSASVIGIEALGDYDGGLLLGGYSSNSVEVYDTAGNLRRSIPLSSNAGITGVDSDGTNLYVASYLDGDIYVYDLQSGQELRRLATGIGGSSLSGLCYDRRSHTLWVSTGFGQDDIRNYDLGGNLLSLFPANHTSVYGLDYVDSQILTDVPNFVAAATAVDLRAFDGLPGSPVAFVLSSVDHSPLLAPLILGRFDPGGTFTYTSLLPPGSGAMVLGYTAYAFDGSGHLLIGDEDLVYVR